MGVQIAGSNPCITGRLPHLVTFGNLLLAITAFLKMMHIAIFTIKELK